VVALVELVQPRAIIMGLTGPKKARNHETDCRTVMESDGFE
jgi:hypothetical protein